MKRRSFIRTGLAASAGLVLPRPALSAIYASVPSVPPEVVAVTGNGEEVVLSGDAIAELVARLRGRLLLAEDDGYDDARRILNPSFDKYPALIAQVTGPADIQTAVNFARENGGLLLAVKCGGHSFSGQSTCDRGMMIDLSPFRSVHVDPVARTARVTGGSLLGAVDHETMAHGLVTTLGTVSHTGVGGLVTGGGFGRVARRFGLSIDNLLSVDIVTADGELRHASGDENPDLFWGVRGGGGNFGVVTSFEFRLHPMQQRVVAGSLEFPLSRAHEVLSLWADYAPQAPEELQLDAFVELPPGDADGVAGFKVCYSGEASNVERALAPIRRLGTPLREEIEAADYVAAQRSGDISDPRAGAMYLKSGFIPELPQPMISAIVEGLEGRPERGTGITFVQTGGAIARVAAGATAFPQRDALAIALCNVRWRHGDDSAEHVRWIRSYWAELERFTHGFYVNDVELDQTAADIQATYRRNHERLVAVKNRYDPTNMFRLNANIQPTV